MFGRTAVDRSWERTAWLAAIDSSQAVIEFDMGGHVLTANANFLDALGYTLPEIQGKHHGMFLSSCPDFAADYGPVHLYRVRLGQVFDSLDEETIRPLLPLEDPYDDTMLETVEAYMKSCEDTWERIEAVEGSCPGDTLLVTEGGVVNYLLRDGSRATLLGPHKASA